MAETSGVILGTNMLLYVDDTAISYSTDCSISISGPGAAEVNHKDSNNWMVKLKKKGITWTASASGMMAFDGAGTDLRDLFLNLTDLDTVNIKMSTATAGNLLLHGSAVITGFSLEAPNDEGGTFSVEFEGIDRLQASVT